MSSQSEHALRSYLALPATAPWCWLDEGDVLAWRDGGTIAFRAEVEAVLRRLSAHGLPPFGAIAWLLAACRSGSGQRAVDELTSQLEVLRSLLNFSEEFGRVVPGVLRRISELPENVRTSTDAKGTLAEMLFEDQSLRTTPEFATTVVTALEHGGRQHVASKPAIPDRTLRVIVAELHALRDGADRISADALQARLGVGFEHEIKPAPVEVEPTVSARDWIASLKNDPELGGVARLAQQLLPVTQLLRALSDPDELPLGGVSDITNRGDFDRLLCSELAHDDTTLMIRVATNEALYLRREVPPRTPQRCRSVLVDVSLRMWGVPRVYAAAVALAFAATADKHGTCSAWRPSGKFIVEIDLLHRPGLTALLEALEMSRHPGDALGPFHETLSDGNNEDDVEFEPVLITTEDVLADREFQHALAAWPGGTLYIATVQRDGSYRLRIQTARGQRVLREAQLSLDELLEAPQATVPLIDKQRERGLPAILLRHQFPLRLSLAPLSKSIWPAEAGGTLALTGCGCLLHWDKPQHGGRLLSDRIAKGSLRAWGNSPQRQTHAIVGHDLLTIEYDGTVTTVRISDADLLNSQFVYYSGFWLVIAPPQLVVLNAMDGEVLAQQPIPSGYHWTHGRMFRDADGWFALSYQQDLHFERVCLPYVKGEAVVGVIEPPSYGEPLLVMKNGGVRTSEGKVVIEDTPAVSPLQGLLTISRDHERLLLPKGRADTKMTGVIAVDLARRVCFGVPYETGMEWVTAPRQSVSSGNLRNNFDAVAVTDGGELCLRMRKGCWLVLEEHHQQLLWLNRGHQRTVLNPRGFQPLKTDVRVRYRLQVAEFPSGTRVVLDSRGMLHCQSGDASIPEFTLMLVDGMTALWCANGQTAGYSYFLDSDTHVPIGQFVQRVLQPFLQRFQ